MGIIKKSIKWRLVIYVSLAFVIAFSVSFLLISSNVTDIVNESIEERLLLELANVNSKIQGELNHERAII